MQKVHEVEIFKEIAGFPGYYISTFGRVKSHKRKTECFVTLYDDTRGYLGVHLWKDNKQYPKKVHRLVAEAFIDNPSNLRDVNHKDENKRNYYINFCIKKNLSSRALEKMIKSNAYERLSIKGKENINIITKEEDLTISDMLKNPIYIEVEKIDKINLFLHKILF